jgi:hypothetical protein
MWVVGFTSSGAPYGLRACEFDPDDPTALGGEEEASAPWVDDLGLFDDLDGEEPGGFRGHRAKG